MGFFLFHACFINYEDLQYQTQKKGKVIDYELSTLNRESCRSGGKQPPRISFRGGWLNEMGFIPDALVQALPEQDGMLFQLWNENIGRYSDLHVSTREKGGNLIHVYHSEATGHEGTTLVTTGKYIYSGGLAIGDVLIAKYEYGSIKVKKIDLNAFPDIKFITVTGIKEKHTGTLLPKVRLYGDWLNGIGFVPDALVIAFVENGKITFRLQDEGIEKYSAFVKYARENKGKLIQIRTEGENLPVISISGSFVQKAGFATDDMLTVTSEHSLICLQKPDFEKLGF